MSVKQVDRVLAALAVSRWPEGAPASQDAKARMHTPRVLWLMRIVRDPATFDEHSGLLLHPVVDPDGVIQREEWMALPDLICICGKPVGAKRRARGSVTCRKECASRYSELNCRAREAAPA